MLKKNPNKKNSAADDLLSSLLEDVDQLESSPDDKSELEPTFYGSAKINEKDSENSLNVASNFLTPSFEAEKSMPNLGLNLNSTENVLGDDFWEQAERMASKQVNHSQLFKNEEYKNLEVKPRYDGPEASSDFIDQVNRSLSPVHKSGVVNTNSDASAGKSSYDSNSESAYEKSGSHINDSKLMQGIPRPTEESPQKTEYNDFTLPIPSNLEGIDIQNALGQGTDAERTVAVTQFVQKQNKMKSQNESEATKNASDENADSRYNSEDRIMLVTQQKVAKGNSSQVSIDASLAQAENLRMAQNRILDLEKEIERLRQENDEILTASEILRSKAEEFTTRISELEKESQENRSDFKNEISILKGNLSFKDSDNQKLKSKVEELESRIKTDFKKIRIRERELENRLELIKAEKQAVAKSKDELLLDLQRKNDQAKSEIDSYREKVQELNKSLENNQSQIKMTVRALRIALSHIEDKSDSSTTIKKAN